MVQNDAEDAGKKAGWFDLCHENPRERKVFTF